MQKRMVYHWLTSYLWSRRKSKLGSSKSITEYQHFSASESLDLVISNIFLNIVGGGYSIGASITFAAFSVFVFMLISSSLYAVAKPNMGYDLYAAYGPSIILT